jgi:formylglycine-generating enzyme
MKYLRVRRLLPLILLAMLIQGADTAYAQEKKKVNALGMEFVRIAAGTFVMGSPPTENERDRSENQHRVSISEPFYMQTTEVTVGQWREVMGWRWLARKKGAADMPVVKVSWHDCRKFIEKLNRRTGDRYELPTEAQWEYAARAGSTAAYFWGDDINCTRAMYANNPIEHDACISANTILGLESSRPAPVKRYPPNAWGLYDMHGNVWEWCLDLFGSYMADAVIDPCRTDAGDYRVRRGGSWFGPGQACRSANRAYAHPMSRLQNTGFRLVMIVSDPADDSPLSQEGP